MKANIDLGGRLIVEAETSSEAFALKQWHRSFFKYVASAKIVFVLIPSCAPWGSDGEDSVLEL